MFYDFNCDFGEDFNAISLNLLVHKQDGHEICDKLIVATVSDDQEYDHENENTAVDFELIGDIVYTVVCGSLFPKGSEGYLFFPFGNMFFV